MIAWIAALVAAYLVGFFVLPYFVLPFVRKEPVPSRLPRQLEEAIQQLERTSKNQYEYVRDCAEFILSANHCGRIKTLTRVDLAFERDLRELLKRRGFMHCHHLNHLMRVMLVRSRFFTDEHVRIRSSLVNCTLHQYLQVRMSGQWYDVDLGGDCMKVPLGRHAWGFR